MEQKVEQIGQLWKHVAGRMSRDERRESSRDCPADKNQHLCAFLFWMALFNQ